MSRERGIRAVLGGGVTLSLLLGGGAYAWADHAAQDRLKQTWTTHELAPPAGWPLAGAADRGQHLVASRYACAACHGADLGGGVMLDDPALGRIPAPNITTGGPVADYTAADWDRIVRHGVKPDGTTAMMPSDDFVAMSDQELSDIVAYLRSLPPVRAEREDIELGPVGTFLVATGRFPLSAERHPDHQAEHAALPPEAAPDSVAFGEHLLAVCTGCHRAGLEGGPMPFGPPDWPAASNLTPHEDGLDGWTFEGFEAALTEGVRPDGSALSAPMAEMVAVTRNATEVELRAMWTALVARPPRPTGE